MDKIIVALDQMSLDDIDVFLSKQNNIPFVKIGLELFIKYGPDLIHKTHQDYGKKIFLDLKLHDIPVTVAKSISSLKNLPINFLTIHLSGGEKMVSEAMKEARLSLPECKILGVSFLTSLEVQDLQSLFGISDMSEAFMRLFHIAHRCGVDGVVCSPLEVAMMKKHFPQLLAVTPGIRFQDEIDGVETQDQKRVATPSEALKMGSDYLVMGRSLTKAVNLEKRLEELRLL